jgi:hypothetical protein
MVCVAAALGGGDQGFQVRKHPIQSHVRCLQSLSVGIHDGIAIRQCWGC